MTKGPRLLLAAFWIDGDPERAFDAITDAVDGIAIPESGSLVTHDYADARMRSMLRTLDLEEAANAG